MEHLEPISTDVLPRVKESKPTAPPAGFSSFRDPAGRVIIAGDRILRWVTPQAADETLLFLRHPKVQTLMREKKLVPTWEVSESERKTFLSQLGAKDGILLEHAAVPFPSYVHEWSPEMLHDAGKLTLQLADVLAEEHISLKDATPFNIMFQNGKAVFIDFLSFERRDPRDPTWLPFAQFLRTFILPLLANKYLALPLSAFFASHREGLEPVVLSRMAGPVRRLLPPFLGAVTLPALFSGKKNRSEKSTLYEKKVTSPERARFTLQSLFGYLSRRLTKVSPRNSDSAWARYTTQDYPYSEAQLSQKTRFIQEALKRNPARLVLDIGCNTGTFSEIAARAGASVVSIDSDPAVTGRLWRRASEQALDILPLTVSFSNPSPGTGWRNRECPSFVDRAENKFDVVMALAVIHHILITDRVPLAEVLEHLARLTKRTAIIEWVGQNDLSFKHLCRGRDYAELTSALFEETLKKHFTLTRREAVEGTDRILYELTRKA